MAFAHIILFVLLHVAVWASPATQIGNSPITLPIAARINVTGGIAALIQADKARFAALRAKRAVDASRGGAAPLEADAQVPVPVANRLFIYTCDVSVGNPSTSYTLLVDTGSSNTWIGANKTYARTATSKDLSQSVSVTYGSGSFTGREYSDTVQIGSAAIQAQSIGVATSSDGFDGLDGILGLGPVGLTRGTLSPDSDALIPTVTDKLRSQGFISSTSIGISFQPVTQTSPSVSGWLDFGGVDPSKFTGTINYAPVTTVEPSSQYWGITQGITYGNSTTILNSTSAGIVDTGTTLLYLPSDGFLVYEKATGGVRDAATGLLKLTEVQYECLESLHFVINRVSYEFTANAQIWPRHLNPLINGDANSAYLIVADSGTETGSGLDFVNGFVWLLRYYTVCDTDGGNVGFATTPDTYATTN